MREDLSRYSRQIFFPPIGEEGQERLSKGFALVVGCGATGSTSASLLARAGVGHLKIIDRDILEETNLQRQELFDEEDLRQGLPKAILAERKLKKINSTIQIEGVAADLNPTNIERLAQGANIILDGTDNFETRLLINDYAVKTRIPWVYGSCLGSQGLVMDIVPRDTPCLRCIVDKSPPAGVLPTCDTAGILASTARIVASLQAVEAIKILTGQWDAINRSLISVDAWEGSFKKLDISGTRLGDCPACGLGRYDFLEAKVGAFVTTLCGSNAVQIVPVKGWQNGLEELAQRLSKAGRVSQNPFLLRFETRGLEMVIFSDGRAIVLGTQEPSLAKELYSKYVGM